MYVSGQLNNFENRLHTANLDADLEDYLAEGNFYVSEHEDLPYQVKYKWAREYVKKKFSLAKEYIPKDQWPFVNELEGGD